MTLRLPRTATDAATLDAAYEDRLRARDGSFRSAFPGETSTLLRKVLSGAGAHVHYRLDAAILNAYMPTAFSKVSIFGLSSLLGGEPGRKTGARVIAEGRPRYRLTAPYAMPAWTRFEDETGREWHTRSDVTFEAGAEVHRFVLHQGALTSERRIANGRAYQMIAVGADYATDAETFVLGVQGVTWRDAGPYLVPVGGQADKRAYATRTLPDGRVLVLFGNGLYGAVPRAGAAIVCAFARTVGSAGNTGRPGMVFTALDPLIRDDDRPFAVDVIAASAATGGRDEDDKTRLKATAPRGFANNLRTMRAADYREKLRAFGNIAAASIWSEYDESLRRGRPASQRRNEVRYSVVRDAVYRQRHPLGQMTPLNRDYTLPFRYVNVIRGTVFLTTPTTTFTDFGGHGILTSPAVSRNCAPDGIASSNSTRTEANLAPSWAFDATIAGTELYVSAHAPTDADPVRLALDFGAARPRHVRSFRLLSSDLLVADQRRFPSEVVVNGTNVASPSLASDAEWSTMSDRIPLADPGGFAWTPWITLRETRAYRHIMLRFSGGHGPETIRVRQVQMQAQEDSSTVDYGDGVAHLRLDAVPATTFTPSVAYLTPDLGQTERELLAEHIRPFNHYTTRLTYEPPIGRNVRVEAEIGVIPTFEPAAVKRAVEAALVALFALDADALGRVYYLSDIQERINTVPGVDYLRLARPAEDILLGRQEFAFLDAGNIACTYPVSLRPYGSTR